MLGALNSLWAPRASWHEADLSRYVHKGWKAGFRSNAPNVCRAVGRSRQTAGPQSFDVIDNCLGFVGAGKSRAAFAKFSSSLRRHLDTSSKPYFQFRSIVPNPVCKLKSTLRSQCRYVAQDHVNGESWLTQSNECFVSICRFYDKVSTMPKVVGDNVTRNDVAIDDQNGRRQWIGSRIDGYAALLSSSRTTLMTSSTR